MRTIGCFVSLANGDVRGYCLIGAKRLRDFCRERNDYEEYAPLVAKMSDEEYANLLLTLCHQTDKMMCAYLRTLEQRFVTEGGIKERMYAARTGYRKRKMSV